MNAKERLLATFKFTKKVAPPNWDTIGFWDETIKRWRSEGLPENITPVEYFKMDKMEYVGIEVNTCLSSNIIQTISHFHLPVYPPFKKKILSDDNETITYQNEFGAIIREYKRASEMSMPQWISFPVNSKKDFEKIKNKLNPYSKCRYPNSYLIKKYSNRDFPLGLQIAGTFGFLRDLMGLENLSYCYYDDPKLIEDIIVYWLYFEKAIVTNVMQNINIDYVYIWEDMAYKGGPLISPSMFKKFMLPSYIELINYIKKLGCENIMVDSDGDDYLLLPLFIKAGVNGFLPVEVAAGMDPLKIREIYGDKLMLWGGIDKRVLSKSKSDIEKEVYSKLPILLESGGYIPAVDHSVPPDVPFENYKFFIKLIREITHKICCA